MENVKLDSLSLLLKAPSKEFVVSLCDESFALRDATAVPIKVISRTAQNLGVSQNEAKRLHTELKSLIKRAVFVAETSRQDLGRYFPDNCNTGLADLIINTIIERLPQWKTYVANNLVFLPRLVDFDWRVDVKSSSDALSRISVPTCLLQLQVQDSPSLVDVVPPTSFVNVELSRQTLDTMLDSLIKIRDQLSSVANKE